MSEENDTWEGLEFGEGVYLDHEEIAYQAEREESQEIEDFWAREQFRHELFGDDWDTDYEKRKSKARWGSSMYWPGDWDCE